MSDVGRHACLSLALFLDYKWAGNKLGQIDKMSQIDNGFDILGKSVSRQIYKDLCYSYDCCSQVRREF